MPYYSDPLAFVTQLEQNALHLAAGYNNSDIVELICNHIRVVNHLKDCTVKDGTTATSEQRCSCPATYPRLEDIDLHGFTALHIGLTPGSLQVVSSLLQCSKSLADTPFLFTLCTKPKYFLTGEPLLWDRALHYAILLEESLGELYKILVEGGANVNLLDSEGYTPLTVAMEYERAEAVAFLLSHGATPSPPKPSKNHGHTIARPTQSKKGGYKKSGLFRSQNECDTKGRKK